MRNAWMIGLAAVMGLGCDALTGKPEKDTDKGEKAAADDKPEKGKTSATEGPTRAVTSPEQQSYAMDDIKAIDASCASPSVIIATAPESVGVDYDWPWTRQAMLANQQFRVVSGKPSSPGEVSFELHQANERFNRAFVIVGKCQDGGTCNRLAAMIHAVVPFQKPVPQPVCGKLPQDLGGATLKKPITGWGGFAGDPKSQLPAQDDVKGLCARLQACTVAMTPAQPTEMGLECQKAPSKLKTSCARNYPCAEVMACLNR